jgi:putative hydrolase of the HAD superfamily
MIKAILFDMVGVLIFKKENYSAKTQDEINAENIEKLFNHLDDNKLILNIKQNLELNNIEIEQAARLIPEKYEKFEKLWKLLPELKKKYKLVVINNGNAIAKKYWDEKFNFGIFDIFINSAEEGIKKPNPKIFLLACEKINVKPEECLFMDDSLENNEAAKNLGMKTIWWNKNTDKKILFQSFSDIFLL